MAHSPRSSALLTLHGRLILSNHCNSSPQLWHATTATSATAPWKILQHDGFLQRTGGNAQYPPAAFFNMGSFMQGNGENLDPPAL